MFKKKMEAYSTNSAARLCGKEVKSCDGDVSYGKEVEGTKFIAG